MYKCDNCGCEFEEPYKLQEDTGEIFNVCPDCKETDYYELETCKICGEYFNQDELWNGMCEQCLKDEFEVHRGLKFVECHKTDFYLDYLYGIKTSYRTGMNKKLGDLIKLIENDYLTSFDWEDDLNGNIKLLREYCLDDLSDWAAFVEEVKIC